MTQNYTGMKKGISLVEMIVAIILFATLAAIGLKYTKQYLNTDMQAKKARIAALTDQATQLSQAYQIYKTEYGTAITALTDLNGSSAIMTELPVNISEIGGTIVTPTDGTWVFNSATTIAAYPHAFTYKILTKTDNSNELYCALFNHEFNTSVDLNVSQGEKFFDAASIALAYAASGHKQFCYSNGADALTIVSLQP